MTEAEVKALFFGRRSSVIRRMTFEMSHMIRSVSEFIRYSKLVEQQNLTFSVSLGRICVHERGTDPVESEWMLCDQGPLEAVRND